MNLEEPDDYDWHPDFIFVRPLAQNPVTSCPDFDMQKQGVNQWVLL